MKVIPRLGVCYCNENKPAQLSAITVPPPPKKKKNTHTHKTHNNNNNNNNNSDSDKDHTAHVAKSQDQNEKKDRTHFKTRLPPAARPSKNFVIQKYYVIFGFSNLLLKI